MVKVILGVLLVIAGCGTDNSLPSQSTELEDLLGTWVLTRIERGFMAGPVEQIDQTDSMYVECFDFTVVKMTLDSDETGQVWVAENGIVTGPCPCYWTGALGIHWICEGDPSSESWNATRSSYSNQNEMLLYSHCQQDWHYWTYNRE